MMTKEEAIVEMKKGNKVTHIYFGDTEWITMKGNKIFTEEGYSIFANEFWQYRESESFQKDWSIKTV